jgi:hypothetical protein
MATSNFGLESFGAEGSLSQNGYKFTLKDREIIDALVWTLFQHDHRATQSAQLEGPGARPTVTAGTGGTFKAGSYYYYRISYLDVNGNETQASQEQAIVFDPALTPPAAPTLVAATTGGTLDPGVFRYALSFYQTGGYETTAPNYGSVTTTGSTSQITVGLPTPPAGADGWNIYRRGPTDPRYYYLASVAATATPPTEYVDTGAVLSDCLTYLPTANTTNGGNSATIAIEASDLPLAASVVSWRVYRTKTSGSYPASSLVVTVTDTTTEGGSDLVTSYIDTGGSTSAGVPLLISTTPPAIAQLDAGDVFSASSSPLPAVLAPRGVHSLNFFLTAHDPAPATPSGEGLQAGIHHMVYTPVDIPLERIGIKYQDFPMGLDGSNYLTWRFSNDAATPLTHDVVVDYELATPDGYYVWQSATTDAGEAEAEDEVGGLEVSDLLATNDVAMELDTQYEMNYWEAGTLEPGDYIARFYVRDYGQTNGSLVLRVRDDLATPTTLATTTINSPGPIFYDPPQTLNFTVTSSVAVVFEAEKTDANSNDFRVDKYEYVLDPPTFVGGSTITVELLVNGSPSYHGDDANFTVWY